MCGCNFGISASFFRDEYFYKGDTVVIFRSNNNDNLKPRFLTQDIVIRDGRHDATLKRCRKILTEKSKKAFDYNFPTDKLRPYDLSGFL